MADDNRECPPRWNFKSDSDMAIEISDDDDDLPSMVPHPSVLAMTHESMTTDMKRLEERAGIKADVAINHRSATDEDPRKDSVKSQWDGAALNQNMPSNAAEKSQKQLGSPSDHMEHSNMSPGLDGWKSSSNHRSPKDVNSRPNRYKSPPRSRSTSRSRNRRSRSRSRSRGRVRRSRSKSRSRSPYLSNRGSDRRVDRGRAAGGYDPPCRDFVAGRCRRGPNCRFLHDDGGRRESYSGRRDYADRRVISARYDSGFRENYSGPEREREYERERDHSRSSRLHGHGSNYDDGGNWERSESRGNGKYSEKCYDYSFGRCTRGASCRYIHDEVPSKRHRTIMDDPRDRGLGRSVPESSVGRTDSSMASRAPCKYFVDGLCRRGESCSYLHEDAFQGRAGESVSSDSWGYRKDRDRVDHTKEYLYGRDQSNLLGTSSRGILPTPGSAVGSGSRYERIESHAVQPTESQFRVSPSSQQHIPEHSSAQQLHLVSSTESIGKANNDEQNEKVAIADRTQIIPSAAYIAGSQLMNPDDGLGSNQVAQNNYAASLSSLQISPTGVTIKNDLPLPANDARPQVQYNGPETQSQMPVSQVPPSYQSQTVLSPHVLSQHGFNLGGQILQNLPSLVQTNPNLAEQVLQNVLPLLAGQNLGNGNIPVQGQHSLSMLQGAASGMIPQALNHSNQIPFNLHSGGLTEVSLSTDNAGTKFPESNVNAPVVDKVVSTDQAAKIQDLSASLAQFFGNAGLNGSGAAQQSSLAMLGASSAGPADAHQQLGNVPWIHPLQVSSSAGPADAHQQQGNVSWHPLQVSTSGSVQPPPGFGSMPQPSATTSVSTVTQVQPTAPAKPARLNKSEATDEDDAAVVQGGSKNKKSSSKELKAFKCALVEFVKDLLKPAWKEGNLSRESHKTIVKKVVEKVVGVIDTTNVPKTQDKIDIYLSYSKEKLSKLVQAYVEKYVKN